MEKSKKMMLVAAKVRVYREENKRSDKKMVAL